MNLVQQTGTGAVVEHAVFAGADAENLLQQLDALLGRIGIRIRAEVLMLAIGRAAIVGQAREFLPGQHDIWIRLIVPEQYVIAWS